jgi:branched-chain amino acid transport system substrate-binding protein
VTSKRVLAIAALLTTVGLAVAATGFTNGSTLSGTVYLGMDSPLTGAQQVVGRGDRETVDALVRYWNGHGGIKGRRLVVDIVDDSSNPSQAVQNVQKFISDTKYAGILGSGTAAAALATGPIASQAKIPFIALSPPTPLVQPPQPYVYIAIPTARLFAYNLAGFLRSRGIKRIWLMGDNGGFGRDGPTQVSKLARAYGFTIVDTTIFAPTTGDFSAELAKVKNSNAQALWLWTATPAGNTIVKQFRQLQLPQKLVLTGANVSQPFLQGTCPDANGAFVNSYLGTVWPYLPKRHAVRKQAALVQRLVGHPLSNFDVDAASSLYAFRAAMVKGGFSRAAINNAIQTKLGGVVTPGGWLRLSRSNHTGLQLESMWAGTISKCKPKPLWGPAFTKKRKK